MNEPARDSSPVETYSPGYLRYALGVLCVVYIVNFLDRQILSILLQSIKEDLGLSDVELGLLWSGFHFWKAAATLEDDLEHVRIASEREAGR